MEWFLVPTGRVRVDPGGAFGVVPRSLYDNFYKIGEDNLMEMWSLFRGQLDHHDRPRP